MQVTRVISCFFVIDDEVFYKAIAYFLAVQYQIIGFHLSYHLHIVQVIEVPIEHWFNLECDLTVINVSVAQKEKKAYFNVNASSRVILSLFYFDHVSQDLIR